MQVGVPSIPSLQNIEENSPASTKLTAQTSGTILNITTTQENKASSSTTPTTTTTTTKQTSDNNSGCWSFILNWILPYIALVCIPLSSSINAVLTRASYVYVPDGKETFSPFAFAALRTYLAFFVFAVYHLGGSYFQEENEKENRQEQKKSPSLRQLLISWFLGVLTFWNILAFLFAVEHITGVVIASFLSLIPPLVYFLGYMLRLEKFVLSRTVATFLCVIGNLIMIHVWRLLPGFEFENDESSSNQHQHQQGKKDSMFYVGCFLMLVAIVCASFYILIQRPLASSMGLTPFLFNMYGAGFICCIITSLFPVENIITSQLFSGNISMLSWLAVLFGGVVQSAGNFFLMSYTTTKLGSSVIATLFRSSAPVFVVIESVIFLHESFDDAQVVGGILVLISILITIIPVIMAERDKVMKHKAKADFEAKQQEEKEKEKYDDVEAIQSGDTVEKKVVVVVVGGGKRESILSFFILFFYCLFFFFDISNI